MATQRTKPSSRLGISLPTPIITDNTNLLKLNQTQSDYINALVDQKIEQQMIALNKKMNKRTQPECDYINALVDQKIEQQMIALNKKMNKRSQPECDYINALVDQKFEQQMIALNKKFNVKRTQPECDYINALVDQKIEQQMNKWNKKMNAKRNQPEFNSTIALLQHKIDQHVSWNEQMNAAYNGQLSKLQGDISTINSTIENIVADIDRNKKSLIRNNLHKAELEKYREYMDTSHEWQFTISNRVDNIERKALQVTELLNEIKVLENKIADIEQRGREKNIEISNLPENNDEDLYKVLEELCGLMEISVNLSDIESINRVPHMDKNDQRPRNIIVKFFTKRQRDKVLQNCKPTKGFMVMGKPHMVFINEHLTIRNKLLYKQCREAAKRNDFKYTWIKHGVILIRKSDISPVFAVRTHDEIAKIQ